ncbi:MAG: hypothetical protein ACRC5H_00210 [Treponemataceae bacterium]
MKAKAEVDYVDHRGYYNDESYKASFSLTGASRNGHIEIVKLLLKVGAPVTQEDLRAALSNKHTEVAELLRASR